MGGILIEFAFSIPILIVLLLFVCDHYRYYELKNKIKSSAYLAASMIQQIGNTRTNKQLTASDMQNVTYASCLNLFHSQSMFPPFSLGIFYSACFNWVKRIDSNSYSWQQGWATTIVGNSPATIHAFFGGVYTKNLAQIKSIHADLVCEHDGDERLLIICAYRRSPNFNKSLLGFFLLEPRLGTNAFYGANSQAFFEYMIVITPKPGLFPGEV